MNKRLVLTTAAAMLWLTLLIFSRCNSNSLINNSNKSYQTGTYIINNRYIAHTSAYDEKETFTHYQKNPDNLYDNNHNVWMRTAGIGTESNPFIGKWLTSTGEIEFKSDMTFSYICY